jgi:hypothetical protein
MRGIHLHVVPAALVPPMQDCRCYATGSPVVPRCGIIRPVERWTLVKELFQTQIEGALCEN